MSYKSKLNHNRKRTSHFQNQASDDQKHTGILTLSSRQVNHSDTAAKYKHPFLGVLRRPLTSVHFWATSSCCSSAHLLFSLISLHISTGKGSDLVKPTFGIQVQTKYFFPGHTKSRDYIHTRGWGWGCGSGCYVSKLSDDSKPSQKLLKTNGNSSTKTSL